MATPSVSVIMPAFNAERYLGEAIESALGQTVKDLEVMVVDDGSTDGTLEIAKGFAQRDSRVRVASCANSGPAGARNKALRLAQADWVAFLDADDVALPHRLGLQLEFLAAHPIIEVLGGAMEEIDANGRPTGAIYRPPQDDLQIRRHLQAGCPFVQSTVVASREAILKAGGYRCQYLTAEDYDLWLRMMETCKFANLPEILVRYRVHWASASFKRILHHAVSAPAARAAARMRAANQEDPSDGVDSLTVEALRQLGFGPQDVLYLQADAIIRVAGKMVSRGCLSEAEEMLGRVKELGLGSELRSKVEPSVLVVRARIRRANGKSFSAFGTLAKALVRYPSFAGLCAGKLWRLGRRKLSH